MPHGFADVKWAFRQLPVLASEHLQQIAYFGESYPSRNPALDFGTHRLANIGRIARKSRLVNRRTTTSTSPSLVDSYSESSQTGQRDEANDVTIKKEYSTHRKTTESTLAVANG